MRNVSYAICEQQRRRSACASAQSDQRLCRSLRRQNDTSSLYIRNFKILAGRCSSAGQFVACLVGDSWRHIFSWHGSITNATLAIPLAVLYIRDNPKWSYWSQRIWKYNLHYDEVRGDILGPPHLYCTPAEVKINQFWQGHPLDARLSHKIWLYQTLFYLVCWWAGIICYVGRNGGPDQFACTFMSSKQYYSNNVKII